MPMDQAIRSTASNLGSLTPLLRPANAAWWQKPDTEETVRLRTADADVSAGPAADDDDGDGDATPADGDAD